MRHPAIAAAIAGGALILMALPVMRLHTAQSGLDALPNSAPTVPTIKKVQSEFSNGTAAQSLVAIKADADAPATQHAVAALKAKAVAAGITSGSIDTDVNASHTVVRIDIPLVGQGTDNTSMTALRTLRNDVLPATVGKLDGVEYGVTGPTATSADENALLKAKAPIVFGFVLVFAFLLLLVTFRSLVVAAKAIVLNLLSVGAAYGVLVAVFQWGWGAGLLGFTSNGGIAQWLPIFMFVILFGLSMDYHVFILSRVREAYDRGRRGLLGRPRHGRRVRSVRADADPRHEGDGHRPRGRRPDRRHDRPRSAAACDDEAARRLELVPAEVAGVAAPPRA
jgi:RND superfamily putative drug exporter